MESCFQVALRAVPTAAARWRCWFIPGLMRAQPRGRSARHLEGREEGVRSVLFNDTPANYCTEYIKRDQIKCEERKYCRSIIFLI